ncbi:MAG: enoyl-CoA hydratase-related protein [Flavobacteriales bacterium]
MSESVLYHFEEGVATLTLNRPQVFNSFNSEMAARMQQLLDDCAANAEVRAVVIVGEGKAFCAGQDLAEVSGPLNPGFQSILADNYNPIVRKIREMEKPVIGAVNGVAAGAGANIALCCDIVVASETSSFIQAFSKIGLIPDSGGTYVLPRLIGFQKASALMMLGDKVDANTAEKMGMIYKVFTAETFATEVKNLALQLAQMPTYGLALTKKALNSSMTNSFEQQLQIEESLQIKAGRSNDYSEGVTAFMEKRKPNFKGN